MVIDTSVLIAILLKEEGYENFVYAMAESVACWLSAATYMETSIVVLSRRGPEALAELDATIAGLDIKLVPVDTALAKIGRKAYATYGKGRHPAKLNLGDCFSYALAKQRGEPLLFKGDDFAKTDIESAL